jgi:hypothetical protein
MVENDLIWLKPVGMAKFPVYLNGKSPEEAACKASTELKMPVKVVKENDEDN